MHEKDPEKFSEQITETRSKYIFIDLEKSPPVFLKMGGVQNADLKDRNSPEKGVHSTS